VNDADGIRTGWSCKIANYEINNIRRKINGECYESMHPYYNGFNHDIIARQSKAGNYTGVFRENAC